MGYGRSGSTLLDILLSNHPDVMSAGALINFFSWVKKGQICACGLPLKTCEFWGPVVQEFFQKYKDSLNLENIQISVEARKHLWKLVTGKLPASLTFQYGEVTRDLFILLANRSGKKYLLDSSKSARLVAGRAYSLSKYVALNVKILYLVRDGRAVIWSAINRAGSPERPQSSSAVVRALNAMVGWVLTNLNCLYMEKYLGKDSVLLVRYEDIVSNPTKELERMGGFLRLPLDLLIQKIHTKMPLFIGHNLGGNRLRFSGEITLQPDFSWQHKLPRFYKLLFWVCAWPLARRFGYSFVP